MNDRLLLDEAVRLLEKYVNEGDRINHAWAYICRYCGECDDRELKHEDGCPYVRLRRQTERLRVPG